MTRVGVLPSVAETPPFRVSLQLLTVAPAPDRVFHAAVIRPRGFRAGTKYPVVVNVYGGPTSLMVRSDESRYLRFHGTTSKYSGLYGRKGLHTVAQDLIGWRREGFTAWVYFNNDLQGHALLDAFELADLLGEPIHLPAAQPASDQMWIG